MSVSVLGVLSLLVALTLSLLITRVAAMALTFTGMSREAEKFQARSAFTGVGYTTKEAENTVNHPVRRQIIMLLMLLGNIGVATVVATIMVSFSSTTEASWQQRATLVAMLCAGLGLLWIGSTSRWVEKRLNRIIAWSMKRFTDLDVRDYVSLLELSSGYAVSEMLVEPGDWLVDKPLAELRLSDEGILILGIRPVDGQFHGTPRGDDTIKANDTLIVYGDLDCIEALDRRRAGRRGDREHMKSVEEQEQFEEIHRLERLAEESTNPDAECRLIGVSQPDMDAAGLGVVINAGAAINAASLSGLLAFKIIEVLVVAAEVREETVAVQRDHRVTEIPQHVRRTGTSSEFRKCSDRTELSRCAIRNGFPGRLWRLKKLAQSSVDDGQFAGKTANCDRLRASAADAYTNVVVVRPAAQIKRVARGEL